MIGGTAAAAAVVAIIVVVVVVVVELSGALILNPYFHFCRWCIALHSST